MDKEENFENKFRIAAVGPSDIISIFKSFDIDCFNVRNHEETIKTIEKIKNDNRNRYAIIFVPDIFLKNIDTKTRSKLKNGNLPTITSIPLLQADSTANIEKIRRLAERAIGSDILK